MSDKNHLKVESPFANLSIDSSVILSGYCTSTPRATQNHLTLGSIKLSFAEEDEVKRNTFLRPEINFASQPIFGRLNMQLLNDCMTMNKGANIKLQDVQLNDEKNTNQPDLAPLKEITNSSCINKHKKFEEDSATITDNIMREFKTNIKKQSNNLVAKTKKVQNVSPRKTINYTARRRRSNPSDNNKPTLKVNSKRPKSPKLLTAIRAKLKKNCSRRNSTEEHKSSEDIKKLSNIKISRLKGTLIRKSNITPKHFPALSTSKTRKPIDYFYVPRDKELELNKENIAKSLKLSEHLQSVKAETKICNKQLLNKQIDSSKNKRMTSYTDQKKIDAQRTTAFKASPINQYSGLPVIKKRQITIPKSPKLGRRKNLSSK